MDLETLVQNDYLLDQVCRDIALEATRDTRPSIPESSCLTPEDLLQRLMSSNLGKPDLQGGDPPLSPASVDDDLLFPFAGG